MCGWQSEKQGQSLSSEPLPESHTLMSEQCSALCGRFLHVLPCLTPGWEDGGSAEEFPEALPQGPALLPFIPPVILGPGQLRANHTVRRPAWKAPAT